jgi:hypothetical protein
LVQSRPAASEHRPEQRTREGLNVRTGQGGALVNALNARTGQSSGLANALDPQNALLRASRPNRFNVARIGRLGQRSDLAKALSAPRNALIGAFLEREQHAATGIGRLGQRSVRADAIVPRNELFKAFIQRTTNDQALGATSLFDARRSALERMRAASSELETLPTPLKALEPQWLVRLRELADGVERYAETHGEAIERFGRMDAERRLRQHEESMGVLVQIAQTAEEGRRQAEEGRHRAEAQAETAHRSLERTARAAEQLRDDVADARKAQRKAERRARVMQAVAIASATASIAGFVLRLTGL